MKKIGLFYGSDEGNTANVAELIALHLSEELVDIIDLAHASAEDFSQYDRIILGAPTWFFGQMQSDWEDFWEEFQAIDFNGKTVALFGLGDQVTYADFFLDAMGIIYQAVTAAQGHVIGYWPDHDYDFQSSKALLADEGHFVGLAIDEHNQEDLTQERIALWSQQLSEEFNLEHCT